MEEKIIKEIKQKAKELKSYDVEFRKKQTRVLYESEEIKKAIEKLQKYGYLNSRSRTNIAERIALVAIFEAKKEYKIKSYAPAFGYKSVNSVKNLFGKKVDLKLMEDFNRILG